MILFGRKEPTFVESSGTPFVMIKKKTGNLVRFCKTIPVVRYSVCYGNLYHKRFNDINVFVR